MPVIIAGKDISHQRHQMEPPTPGRFGFAQILLLAIAGSFIGGMVAALFTLWASTGFKGMGAHGFALYALVIGGGFTLALTTGLMVVLFHSDTAGYDERAYHPDQDSRHHGDDMA